jgi:hypothetical protein
MEIGESVRVRNEKNDVAAQVARLEKEPPLPQGEEERFFGYGVMSVPFESGDLLALRRFPASSVGPGYTSVWHRDPAGVWTFWADQSPLQACPRYFGAAIAHAVETPIVLRWPEARRLEIDISAAQLHWALQLEASPATRFMSRVGALLPERLWRNPRVLALLARVASRILHAGRLGLSGHAPNGQSFVANPLLLWDVRSSSASIAGRDLGRPHPLPEQIHLGDFWLPQRALFAIGRAFFEKADPARHHLVPEGV